MARSRTPSASRITRTRGFETGPSTTTRLTGPMRFSFERDANTFRIKDHQNPGIRDRAINYDTPYLQLTEDFALISRVLDPTTERMVVVVAGLTGYGTVAAGEFVSTPAYMAAAITGAPPER